MSRVENCIFCDIAAGEAPATVVYEDAEVVAFEDIHPIAPVHLLVVPRHHYSTLNEAPPEALLGHLLAVGRALAEERGVAESGYRTLINCNADGGQVVYHIHLHVIGGRKLGPMG